MAVYLPSSANPVARGNSHHHNHSHETFITQYILHLKPQTLKISILIPMPVLLSLALFRPLPLRFENA